MLDVMMVSRYQIVGVIHTGNRVVQTLSQSKSRAKDSLENSKRFSSCQIAYRGCHRWSGPHRGDTRGQC
jgi:hypothetical protein